MAEQFNVRLPDDLARAVRVRAAELGVKPRDVIVEALELLGVEQVPSSSSDGQVRAPVRPGNAAESPPAAREAGGEPSGSSEAPPRADDPARPARRRTNKGTRGSTARPQGRVARAKAGEAGTSGEGASGPAEADRPPAAIEKVDHPASPRSACPDCAGELEEGVCADCGYRTGRGV